MEEAYVNIDQKWTYLFNNLNRLKIARNKTYVIRPIFKVSPSILPITTQINKHWKSSIFSTHFKVFDIPGSNYCQYYALEQLAFLVSYFSSWTRYFILKAFRQNQCTQCKITQETVNLLASCKNIVEMLRRLWVSSHYKITFFGSILESNMVYTFRLFVFVFVKNVPAFALPMESVEKSIFSWTTLFATRVLIHHSFSSKEFE